MDQDGGWSSDQVVDQIDGLRVVWAHGGEAAQMRRGPSDGRRSDGPLDREDGPINGWCEVWARGGEAAQTRRGPLDWAEGDQRWSGCGGRADHGLWMGDDRWLLGGRRSTAEDGWSESTACASFECVVGGGLKRRAHDQSR